MSRTIAVVSHKGGVGKTSLVQNVGIELSRAGHPTLMVDFDPQSNLTLGWGLDPDDGRPTIYDALDRPEQGAAIIQPVRDALDLLPANLDLAGAEIAFGSAADRNLRLRHLLEQVGAPYDFILIDGPPSLGFFTANPLMAATEALVPLQAQVYAYRVMDRLLETLAQARQLNEGLTLTGFVLTMHDPRNNLTGTVEGLVRERFGPLVFETTIPVNVRIAEAPIGGLAVSEYDPGCKGTLAYRKLAKELIDHGQTT